MQVLKIDTKAVVDTIVKALFYRSSGPETFIKRKEKGKYPYLGIKQSFQYGSSSETVKIPLQTSNQNEIGTGKVQTICWMRRNCPTELAILVYLRS